MCLLCVTLLNCIVLFVFMGSLVNQANKRFLTTILPFYYTNLSLKCLKLIQDQVKTIQTRVYWFTKIGFYWWTIEISKHFKTARM